MQKDQLFLLKPGFFKESEGPFYCGDSVAVEGLLSFFSQLRNEIDVHYIDAPRRARVRPSLRSLVRTISPLLCWCWAVNRYRWIAVLRSEHTKEPVSSTILIRSGAICLHSTAWRT